MLQRFIISALVAVVMAMQAAPAFAQSQSSPAAMALPQVIQQGRDQLSTQRADQAFALFREYEPFHAGNPQFDYWYGVAAVRSGEPFEASVALERVIAKQPQHAGARLELVAVYIQLNQLDSAERQLDVLDTLNAPTRAQEAIDRFRIIVGQRREQKSENPQFISLSIDMGYDSNYLNYPDSFDLFANTILQGLAILEADSTTYTNVRGMAWKRWNAPDGAFLEGSLLAQARINHNSAARIFDTNIIHGALFVGSRIGSGSELRFGLEGSQLWLDNTSYRSQTGINIGWKTNLNKTHELLANGAFREFRFHESRNDYIAWSGDVEWRYTLSPLVRLRAKAGTDVELVVKEVTRQGGDATKLFMSAHADFFFSQGNQILTTLGYENQEYSDNGFAVFNHGQAAIRSDNSIRARVEWIYMPSQHWRFSVFGQYRTQSSSIDFFKLDQSLVQGSVSYVF